MKMPTHYYRLVKKLDFTRTFWLMVHTTTEMSKPVINRETLPAKLWGKLCVKQKIENDTKTNKKRKKTKKVLEKSGNLEKMRNYQMGKSKIYRKY